MIFILHERGDFVLTTGARLPRSTFVQGLPSGFTFEGELPPLDPLDAVLQRGFLVSSGFLIRPGQYKGRLRSQHDFFRGSWSAPDRDFPFFKEGEKSLPEGRGSWFKMVAESPFFKQWLPFAGDGLVCARFAEELLYSLVEEKGS